MRQPRVPAAEIKSAMNVRFPPKHEPASREGAAARPVGSRVTVKWLRLRQSVL